MSECQHGRSEMCGICLVGWIQDHHRRQEQAMRECEHGRSELCGICLANGFYDRGIDGSKLTEEQKREYGFIKLSEEDLRNLGIRSIKKRPELMMISTPGAGSYWERKWSER